ncbi:Spo0B domain-containing protein [Halobacillus yeomjeoni]|uniref:Spo0B domain-containing protein n=1 Tax=Halobacillus yeomjeoni TaxID=311194 RepID=UPI001CD53846|nr:Spo0B domain-containing protein [Halobacillus yeomjeoni]MCA0982616.1 Spo0B domain-containing protein [Halobacillus yeomjeoni]
MSEKEMISLLRHKRHDWMNQIQLIHGYATLGRQDRLMDQIDQLREESEQERRLLNSHSHDFSLWLITFNWKHDQFRVKYSIHEDIDLSRHDETLTAYGRRMIDLMSLHITEEALYEGSVHIYQGYESQTLSLSWEWNGFFKDAEGLKQRLNEEGFIATVFENEELSIEMMIE